MRQQRGADAAGAAPQDGAGPAGLEAAVLEPAAVPDRPPQGPGALRPAGPEAPRPELLGDPQADPGGIAGTTVRAGGYAVRKSRSPAPGRRVIERHPARVLRRQDGLGPSPGRR